MKKDKFHLIDNCSIFGYIVCGPTCTLVPGPESVMGTPNCIMELIGSNTLLENNQIITKINAVIIILIDKYFIHMYISFKICV